MKRSNSLRIEAGFHFVIAVLLLFMAVKFSYDAYNAVADDLISTRHGVYTRSNHPSAFWGWTIGDSVVHVCRASDLHQFLRVHSRLADWIKARIRKYKFVPNQDFVIVSEKLETIRRYGEEERAGAVNTLDYLLTLDMAKELSMVENNEQGRAARRYFIQCEKQALASHSPQTDRAQLHAIQTAYLDWSEAAAVEIQRLQGNVPPPPAALKEPAAALAALAHVLSSHRYLLTFSADLRAQLTPIAPGALMIPPGDLPNTIATPGSPIPRNLMPDIIRAAAGRL